MSLNSKTIVRWVESFLIILIVNFGAMITIGGQPLDFSTPEGRSASFSAVAAAVIIAVRRSMASNSATSTSIVTTTSTTTTPPPTNTNSGG